MQNFIKLHAVVHELSRFDSKKLSHNAENDTVVTTTTTQTAN